jgi:hypothetical protein
MMGGIGKAHTIRQALLHAPKVQTELSLILPPLSSVSLPKGEVQHFGKTFVMSLFGNPQSWKIKLAMPKCCPRPKLCPVSLCYLNKKTSYPNC